MKNAFMKAKVEEIDKMRHQLEKHAIKYKNIVDLSKDVGVGIESLKRFIFLDGKISQMKFIRIKYFLQEKGETKCFLTQQK